MIDTDFETYSFTKGNHTITWEYIGEGLVGDYDPNSPNDVKLLRFYYERDGNEIGSYCSGLSVDTIRPLLDVASEEILRLMAKHGTKRGLQLASWIDMDDLVKGN